LNSQGSHQKRKTFSKSLELYDSLEEFSELLFDPMNKVGLLVDPMPIKIISDCKLKKQTCRYVSPPAMIALKLICEDSSEKLAMTSIFDEFIPKLILLMTYPNDSKIRQKSIECMNSLLYLLPTSASPSTSTLVIHINQFLANLSNLSNDSDGNVRKVVCQSLVILTTSCLSFISSNFESICQFMLISLNDAEESVRIEACEFWYMLSRHVSDHAINPDKINQYFPILIPTLINLLILSDEKLQFDRLEDEENENKLNLKPLFHHGISGHNNRHEQTKESEQQDELSEPMTIRKQAATVLDRFFFYTIHVSL
jgi:hypothetical protein